MGLDNFASKYSKRIYLDENVRTVFRNANICLCGHTCGSFRGKRYTVVVDTVCDVSLYGLLCPYTLKEAIMHINQFMTLVQEKQNDEEIDIRTYIDNYNDTYHDYEYRVTKNELHGLRDFFQICVDHDLYIHADF